MTLIAQRAYSLFQKRVETIMDQQNSNLCVYQLSDNMYRALVQSAILNTIRYHQTFVCCLTENSVLPKIRYTVFNRRMT